MPNYVQMEIRDKRIRLKVVCVLDQCGRLIFVYFEFQLLAHYHFTSTLKLLSESEQTKCYKNPTDRKIL